MTKEQCVNIFTKSIYGDEKPIKIAQSDMGPVIITTSIPGVTGCNHYLIFKDKVVPTYPPLCGLDEKTIKDI